MSFFLMIQAVNKLPDTKTDKANKINIEIPMVMSMDLPLF